MLESPEMGYSQPEGRIDSRAGILRFLGEIWVPLLVFFVPIICYWPVVNSGFVSDDFAWHVYFNCSLGELIERIMLQHGGEIELIFFRPAVVASYQLDHALWGADAFGFHLTNLIIHSASAVTLFYLARALGLKHLGASAASLIFALYPAHPEAVTWISGRGDLLALLFLLVSLLCWCAACLRADGRWVVASAAAFMIAVLAKEGAVAGALLFPLIDWALYNRTRRENGRGTDRLWKGYVALVLILIAVVVFRLWLFGGLGAASADETRSRYFDIDLSLVWSRLVLGDMKMMLTPVSRIVWPDWSSGWRFAALATGFLSAIGFIAAATWSFATYRRGPIATTYLTVGVLWIIVMLLPTLPLFPVADTLRGSRFLYSASVGLALMIGTAADVGWGNGKALQGVVVAMLIAILVVSGYALRRQNEVWLDSSEIASRIHAVMASHTEQITDGTDIFCVNFPWIRRGVYCAPVMYGEYLEYRRGVKGVRIFRVTRESTEIIGWWESMQDGWDHPAVGFVWNESTLTVSVLSPIEPAPVESRTPALPPEIQSSI